MSLFFHLLVGWISIVICFGTLIAGYITHNDEQLRILAFCSIVVLILSALVYLALAIYLKYPLCSRRFLIQTYETKSDKAWTKWKIDYWAFVVINVLLRRSFVCMYCGTKYLVNKSSEEDHAMISSAIRVHHAADVSGTSPIPSDRRRSIPRMSCVPSACPVGDSGPTRHLFFYP
jgi:hypothetical protein